MTKVIMLLHRSAIPAGQCLALAGCCGAVRGTTTLTTCAQPTVSTSAHPVATAMLVSVVPAQTNPGFLGYCAEGVLKGFELSFP